MIRDLPKDPAERLVLSVPEVAKVLNIGRNLAYEAAKSGDIPSVRIGRRLLVPIAALESRLAGAARSQLQSSWNRDAANNRSKPVKLARFPRKVRHPPNVENGDAS